MEETTKGRGNAREGLCVCVFVRDEMRWWRALKDTARGRSAVSSKLPPSLLNKHWKVPPKSRLKAMVG